MKEQTFKLSNDGRLKITVEAVMRMGGYAQHASSDPEAGGVLLGRFIKDSKDIIVDQVSVPMIGDKRSRSFFFRNKNMHQRRIDKVWLDSKGTCNYLGEWHTHPERYPSPSSRDILSWKERLKLDTFTSRYLYFVIVGLRETYVWEGDKRTLRIKKLKEI